MTEEEIEKAVDDITLFLAENEVSDYDGYQLLPEVDMDMVKALIYSYTHDLLERETIKFKVELSLSKTKKQLSDLLKKCVKNEEYERCSEITKKMSNI